MPQEMTSTGHEPSGSGRRIGVRILGLIVIAASAAHAAASPGEGAESFDSEPKWDAQNNRSTAVEPRSVRQDFGPSRTRHAGGEAGELGGFISPAAEPAYCALRIPRKTFADPLEASGRLAGNDRPFHVLLGFFNSRTLKEWRTPNTIALRLQGRGDVLFAYVEYATSRWRAGGDNPGGFATLRDSATGRGTLRGFSSHGEPHKWKLRYDPDADGGAGRVTATIDGETAVCRLDPGHKADGAEFDRFGLLNVLKSADGGGELWIDDVNVLGQLETFAQDPSWDEVGNRRTYTTTGVRPRFDFGFSPTRYAGGKAAGELGGVVFRGDCREAHKLASYAARLETLNLARPLHASGKVALRRGVSDSTTLIGFFDSRDSCRTSTSQATAVPTSFLGASIGGPSAEGFYFEPTANLGGGACGSPSPRPPYILPDATPHDWAIDYLPVAGASGPRGRLTVTLDGASTSVEISESSPARTAFDRFGIVTTWIDGNAQEVYFDDLKFTDRP
ncbi:MAG TPA: hypothetical protein VFD71_09160 [Planctomycetota bacterium]|nr:hypothetical protein [Planctomycetota bacterium]